MNKLLVLLLLIGSINGQRILYGLPPLPHDDSDNDLIATPPPFNFPTFIPFTFPPLNHGLFQPLDGLRPLNINPIPELPPIPESRLDGVFDADGNFVPKVKSDLYQIAENRIYGVKVESHPIPNLFHPTQSTPSSRKPYSRARGINIVTVTPNIVRQPQKHVVLRQNTHSESQFNDPVLVQSGKTKNARQWQTTALKLNNHQERVRVPDFDAVENINKIDASHEGLQFDDSGSNDFNRFVSKLAELKHQGSTSLSKTPANKEILTTRFVVEPLGSHTSLSTSTTIAPVTEVFHRSIKNDRVIGVKRRFGNASHGFFEYRPKQRTFQPEQVFVTRAPVVRPRQITNPVYSQIFANIGPTTLPPQPVNRSPEDINLLAEIEEYDWRMFYRQQTLDASSKTPIFQTRPLIQNHAHADSQHSNNPRNENIPETRTNVDSENKEILVPFNSGFRPPISTAHVDQVGNQPGPAFNQPMAQLPITLSPTLGFTPHNKDFLGGLVPHPFFNGLFNLFNFNGAQNARGFNLLPGLGR